MSVEYKKGLHIIWDRTDANADSLINAGAFRDCIHALIEQHGLTQTGEVFHSFPNGGYTAVIGLTESHLSVHTWPEYKRVCFDIFLSNYLQSNQGIVEAISEAVEEFFGGNPEQIQRIER